MKIKSTKNIFKEIKGTNTFEVEMVGKSKDLEKLHRLTSSDVDFQYHYILDMNNIEIIIERDKEGKITSKAIISLIENEETGQLISWKETHSDGLDLQTQGTDIRNIDIKSEVGMKMINSKYIDIDKYINQIEKGVNRMDSERLLKLAADMYGESTKKIMSLCEELDEVNTYLKILEDLMEIERTHQDEVYRKMYEISVVDNNK